MNFPRLRRGAKLLPFFLQPCGQHGSGNTKDVFTRRETLSPNFVPTDRKSSAYTPERTQRPFEKVRICRGVSACLSRFPRPSRRMSHPDGSERSDGPRPLRGRARRGRRAAPKPAETEPSQGHGGRRERTSGPTLARGRRRRSSRAIVPKVHFSCVQDAPEM